MISTVLPGFEERYFPVAVHFFYYFGWNPYFNVIGCLNRETAEEKSSTKKIEDRCFIGDLHDMNEKMKSMPQRGILGT